MSPSWLSPGESTIGRPQYVPGKKGVASVVSASMTGSASSGAPSGADASGIAASDAEFPFPQPLAARKATSASQRGIGGRESTRARLARFSRQVSGQDRGDVDRGDSQIEGLFDRGGDILVAVLDSISVLHIAEYRILINTQFFLGLGLLRLQILSFSSNINACIIILFESCCSAAEC